MIAAAVTAATLACSGTAAPVRVDGSWIGRYRLGGPGTVALSITGSTAVVALGAGHADAQSVHVVRRGPRVRISLPGRPTALTFAARVSRKTLRGSVTQGSARGTFSARHGTSPRMFARGVFSVGDRRVGVVDDPYGPARLVDLDTGEVHGLYGAGPAFTIGSGFANRDPATGMARLAFGGGTVAATSATRIALRQLEVRFPSGGATLSGTLTLPAGGGRHAAVAWVHGSGPTQRAYLPDLAALLVRNGVAVLAYDKRGIGQSGGTYPGESPTDATIDTLARDAEAAARFLASQPEVDAARVGLAGHSQAGWVMPLAASREPAIHELIVFSGPAVTADENEAYQNLTGAGDTPQTMTDAEIDAEVERRGPGGVDPIPWIRRLRIPVLWLYGGLDKTIPERLSFRRLEPIAREPGRDFTIAVFPNGNHALVETTTGLTSEMLRSDRFAPGLFPRVAAWLAAHGLS